MVLAAVVATTTSACGGAFTTDEGFTVTAPGHDVGATAPVDVTWSDSSGRRWAVYVDRTPPGPGARAVEGDRVLIADEPSVELPFLDDHTTAPPGQAHRHEVVVVRLDDSGRRDGEAFAARTFYVTGYGDG